MLGTLEALVTARSENRVMNAAASPLPPHAFCSQTTQDVLQQIIKIDNYLWFIEALRISIHNSTAITESIETLYIICTFEYEMEKKYWCVWSLWPVPLIHCQNIFFICLLLVAKARDDQGWQCVCCCCREIEMGSYCCNLQSAVICQADSANFSIRQFLPFLLTFAISPPRLGSGITFIFFHEDFIKVFIVLINWNFVKETEWWKQTTRKSGGWLQIVDGRGRFVIESIWRYLIREHNQDKWRTWIYL